MIVGDLRQRWIDAMLKISFALVDGKHLTGEMGVTLGRCFNDDAPKHPRREVVESLEAEAEGFTSFSTMAKERTKALTSKLPKARKISKEKLPNASDYPEPWCSVKNGDGEIIRFEDANGQAIPKILWAMK